MSEEEMERVGRLHKRLIDMIDARIEEGEPYKSREGGVRISYVLPDLFEPEPYWVVEMISTLCLPERFSQFTGKTADEALTAAEAALKENPND